MSSQTFEQEIFDPHGFDLGDTPRGQEGLAEHIETLSRNKPPGAKVQSPEDAAAVQAITPSEVIPEGPRADLRSFKDIPNKNDVSEIFYPYLDEIYENEEKFPYLTKVFDTEQEGFEKLKVKVFEINYKKFYQLNN